MMYKTHLAFGFLIGLLGIMLLRPANQILFIAIVVFASVLPDIDHPDSKMGRNIKIIGFLFEHRGFFHSVFALVGFSIAMYLIFKTNVYAIAMLIGYGSHLIMDSLTIKGIMPLHPFTRMSVRGFIKTNSLAETFLFLVFIGVDIWLLLRL